MEFMRVTRRIYRLTRKEPKRFYQAEQFYFSHLDSAVELAEKYVFLSSQPKKTRELDQSLQETRRTLDALTHHVEEDLHRVIAEDIDQLNFEIDVAKNSIEKIKDSRIHDESRRLK
jgi:5-bromo-4-chloroindolyl phosphate hydrolysis protein